LTELTPYDTGEVLEPKVWPTRGRSDRYGFVDFDDDESATQLTVQATAGDDHPVVLGIDVHCDIEDLVIEITTGDGRTIRIAPGDLPD